MRDLNSDPFFDKRVIDLVRALTNGSNPRMSISGVETAIFRLRDRVVALNEEMDGGLVVLLNNTRSMVAPHDALFFLLKSSEKNCLLDARRALNVAVQESMHLDAKTLQAILANQSEMPMEWAIGIFGESNYNRDEPITKQQSSIDLNKMRDGMR